MDITSEAQVASVLAELTPDVIINCAAHTAVDKAETDVEMSYAINRDGPRHLAQAAESLGAVMLLSLCINARITTIHLQSTLLFGMIQKLGLSGRIKGGAFAFRKGCSGTKFERIGFSCCLVPVTKTPNVKSTAHTPTSPHSYYRRILNALVARITPSTAIRQPANSIRCTFHITRIVP